MTTSRERWQAVMQAAIDGALDAGVTPEEIREDIELELHLQEDQRHPPAKRGG